ncbi:MAG: PrsW family intramembrane metalloprotease [Thermoanaerobaculales bacterium]|nr:PrsW family intramembrane metalloprotease [Thermoanaerobaculales bacterium]
MSTLAIATLVGALCLSTLLLVLVVAAVWWFDRYDREPLHMVAGAFLWGGLAAPVVAVAACSSIGIGFGLGPSALASWAGPAIEEIAKAIGIVLIVVLSREFDNPTDGLVYGTAAGLGFAATENLVYTVVSAGDPVVRETLVLVALRTAMAAGIHGASSASFGGCLGFGRLARGRAGQLLWLAVGLVVATAVHSAWNLALLHLGGGESAAPTARWLIALPVLYALFAVLLVAFLRSEQQILRRELDEEVRLGVLPGWVAEVIPYYRRRIRSDWWPSRRERTVLARLLTRLAFRKHALRRSPGEGASELSGLEVVKLRQRVCGMLREQERDDLD